MKLLVPPCLFLRRLGMKLFSQQQQQQNTFSTSTIVSELSTPLIFLRHGQSTWNKQNIFIGMSWSILSFDFDLLTLRSRHD